MTSAKSKAPLTKHYRCLKELHNYILPIIRLWSLFFSKWDYLTLLFLPVNLENKRFIFLCLKCFLFGLRFEFHVIFMLRHIYGILRFRAFIAIWPSVILFSLYKNNFSSQKQKINGIIKVRFWHMSVKRICFQRSFKFLLKKKSFIKNKK